MRLHKTLSTKSSPALLLACAIASAVPYAQADVLDDIKAAGEIKVGVFSDFPPFSSASRVI